MNDELGTRIKEQYENRTRYYLPRRTYTILRLDGCHFHTYTKGLQKPFDDALAKDIDSAVIEIMKDIQGSVFAYAQSDEISILLTDFNTITTSAWFDGNIQKICSVSSSMMTAEFNFLRLVRQYDEMSKNLIEKISKGELASLILSTNLAHFDARTFTIPDRIEVMNYFIWRNQDCSRNSISMVAQSLFSHKELQGKSSVEMLEMMMMKETIWDRDYSLKNRYGRLILKEEYSSMGASTLEQAQSDLGSIPLRNRWVSKDAWRFTENKDKLLDMIPKYE